MKILIMTNYANGLYLFRKELIQKFLIAGMTVKVSVPEDENCKKIEELGCDIIPTYLERRGNNPIHDLKLFNTYLEILKSEKPDIVLTYTIKPNIYGGLACRIRKIPYLCNITGLGTALEQKNFLSKILLLFYRVATKKANCVFFQNYANYQFMHSQRIGTAHSVLLPGSGVNLQEHPFMPYPDEDKGIIFLSVIRIMKDKGIEEYLNAAEMMKQKYPDIQFQLVGEYEEETREYYEPWIVRLEQERVIQYLGHIDNVPEVMADSHIIVHPSYHEGLSNVLLEAAACGRPALTTNVPGCQETVLEGVTGLTFDAKSTERLVQAMDIILSFTKKEREMMGTQGRAFVEENFSRDKVIQSYFQEIHNIIDSNVV